MSDTSPRRPVALAVLLAALAAPTGCGSGPTVDVTGKLLKGGRPYAPPKDQVVTVTLVGLETRDASGNLVKGDERFVADLDDGAMTFAVRGDGGRGIPPGKYRVAVTQKYTREAFEAARSKLKKGVDRETDLLENRFSVEASPIAREIDKSQELVIDLETEAKNAPPPVKAVIPRGD